MFWLTLVTLLVSVHRGEEAELEITKLPCSGDDCWTSSVELPLMCYQCRHCNNVSTNNPKMECKPAACCYIAVVTDYGSEEAFAVRGCVNKSCTDGCKQIQLEHQLTHPNGTFRYCGTCKENECNVNKYIPNKLVTKRMYDGVDCFECRNCDTINATTPTVRCSQPECCYTAVLKDDLDKHNVTIRGCYNQNCSDTCRMVKDQHLQAHAGNMFGYCITCGDGAGDKCNGNPKFIDGQRDENKCFECKECKDIKLDTFKVPCSSKCCYSKIVMGKYQRGCVVDLNGGSCEDYCKKIDDSCDTCSGNSCNILSFPNDTMIADVVDGFKCYSCIDCDTVSSNTPRINCRTNCCATVVKTVHGASSTYRNCVGLDGDSCKQYCGYIAKTSKVDYCKICNGNECNGVPTNQTSLIKRETHIYCYSCTTVKNCRIISLVTTTVYCFNKCCFAKVYRRDDGSVYVRRGCARIRAGCPCSGYCNKARRNHAALHPHSSNKFYCEVCSSPLCNREELDTSFRPRGVTGYYPKTCYNCVNCYDINQDTETVECADGCCYTAIWTEYDRRLLVRLCALLDSKRCDEHCRHIAERVAENTYYGSLHYCRTCCHNKCNSEPPPEYFEPMKADPYEIMCYDCENCDETNKNTHTVPCPTRCCYSQLAFGNDGKRIAERRCAKIFPGTPCHKFCEHSENVHKRYHPRGFVSYCNSCPIGAKGILPNCNNEPLDTGEIGTPDERIKCFVCQGCYNVDSKVAKEVTAGCCYTTLITYLDQTVVKRGYVEKKDTPCADYCESQQIKLLYTDPSAKIYCKTCTTKECNTVKFHEPTTATPHMSCFVCADTEDCKAMTFTVPSEICNSRCCYTKLLKIDDDPITAERGCADLLNGKPCDEYIEDGNRDIKNYTTCQEHECNHISMTAMDEIYNKPVFCYECADQDCAQNETDPANCMTNCTLSESVCSSTCCYSAYDLKAKKIHRGCVDDDSRKCTQDDITAWFIKKSPETLKLVNSIAHGCNIKQCNNEILTAIHCCTDDVCENDDILQVCENKCCISTLILKTEERIRGCADKKIKSCSENDVNKWFAEKHPNDEYFQTVTCESDKCNNIGTTDKNGTVCFACKKCEDENDEDEEPVICEKKCCYEAFNTEAQQIYRGCAKVTEDCTQDTVKTFVDNLNITNLNSTDTDKTVTIEVCTGFKCNKKTKDQWNAPPIQCYTCNYNCVAECEGTRCGKLVDCASNCCYTGLKSGRTNRGCSKNNFGLNCNDTKVKAAEGYLAAEKLKICTNTTCNDKSNKPE